MLLASGDPRHSRMPWELGVCLKGLNNELTVCLIASSNLTTRKVEQLNLKRGAKNKCPRMTTSVGSDHRSVSDFCKLL